MTNNFQNNNNNNNVFSDLLSEVEMLDEPRAAAFEAGVLAVLGIMEEAADTLLTRVIQQAAAEGFPESFARATFDQAFGPLSELAQPRLSALQDATRKAQGIATTEAPSTAVLDQINDTIESLLASLIGKDAAAQARREVDAEIASWNTEAQESDEAKSIRIEDDTEKVVTTPPAKGTPIEKFFNEMFGVKQTA